MAARPTPYRRWESVVRVVYHRIGARKVADYGGPVCHCPGMNSGPEIIAIRTAGAGEADTVLDLMRQAFGAYRGVLQPESSVFRETIDAVRTKLAEGGGVLAVRGSEPVGCIIAEVKGDRGYLGRLAVLPAARRMGVARRLIAEAE